MVARHLADTPARHVRRALRLLEELEDDLRAPASSILGRSDRVGLVVAARRRLRLAATVLGSEERLRRGFLRRLVPVGGVVLRVVVVAGLAAAGLFRFVSRFLRAVLRLVFTLRAI